MIHITDEELFKKFVYQMFVDGKKGFASEYIKSIRGYVVENLLDDDPELATAISYAAHDIDDINKYIDICYKILGKEIKNTMELYEYIDIKEDIEDVDKEKQELLDKIKMLDNAMAELMETIAAN